MKTKTTPTLRAQSKKTHEDYQKFIDLIIALRHLCNLSQEKASEILGIDRATLTKYENLNVNMRLCRYIDICNCYNHYMEEHNIELSEKVENLKEQCKILQ